MVWGFLLLKSNSSAGIVNPRGKSILRRHLQSSDSEGSEDREDLNLGSQKDDSEDSSHQEDDREQDSPQQEDMEETDDLEVESHGSAHHSQGERGPHYSSGRPNLARVLDGL